MNGDIENKLKMLADHDWGKFINIAGEDVLVMIKVRLLREEGKSWKQISMNLNITVSQARTICNKKAANF